MLAANSDLEVLSYAAPIFDCNSNQPPDTGLIENLERIIREDSAIDVRREESSRIVATQTERSLRQVIGAE